MIFYNYFFTLFYFFCKKKVAEYKFKNRPSKVILNIMEANKLKWRIWEATRRHLKIPRKSIFKASGEVKTIVSWWRLPDILTRNKLLFYLSEDIYTTEQKISNTSICLFLQIGEIKIAGYYEHKPTLRWCRARNSFG